MAKWMVAAKKADFDQIAEQFHISPILARIIRNRDIISEDEIEQFLHGGLNDLHQPMKMKGMQEAVTIILQKIQAQSPIRIIGDYDVDGICSTYILYRGICTLGGHADTAIPHRMKDGYGLNESLIETAASDGIDTIITCDNGIAATPQIELAKKLGMTVVVTDHHEVPYETKGDSKVYILPEADAVVDPKQPECSYPYKQICGATVAYKFVQALMSEASYIKREQPEIQKLFSELLSFTALATICDVMELRDENRIIVKEGLKIMEKTDNLGLRALLLENGIDKKQLTPYHAGYIIGPCLNASGRLDTAERALKLFQTTDWKEAVTIAADLKSLNDSRKTMTEEGVKKAISLVEETNLKEDKVLVIFLPDCHESLAGIIAGRIREKYGKPTFVLTNGEEGVKGSGRSIPEYSMYDEISSCKELFTKYGGHSMAAGVSFANEDNAKEFRKKLNAHCTLTEEDFEETIHIDIPMPLNCINRDFLQELSMLEPFGNGNTKPLFARKGISLLSGRKLGKSNHVGKYRIADEYGTSYEMIYFGDLDRFDLYLEERFGGDLTTDLYLKGITPGKIEISMVYYPEVNSYAGRENIQIIMQYYM